MTAEQRTILHQEVLELGNVRQTLVESLIDLDMPESAEWASELTIAGPITADNGEVEVTVARFENWTLIVTEVDRGD